MIDVADLTYTYAKAASPAVKGISFQVEAGEIFGFLGPSGAGKSTTQKILIKLLSDYQGSISVLGRDLRSWGSEFYERIGVSFESPRHYLKLTGRENLDYFRALYSGETAEPGRLLEMVGLGDDADKRVGEYSKGMRVRLNFARALLNMPALLFLDEPTSGLDPVTSRSIRNLIREQRDQGATIFLTTHNMTAADELCDRVAFLIGGRIELIDSPRALKLRYGRRLVRVEYNKGGERLERDFPLEGLADDEEFRRLLREESIETIHTQETTLEEIFIQVTGRALA